MRKSLTLCLAVLIAGCAARTSPSPALPSIPAAPADVKTLVQMMEAAVDGGDAQAYLALVDLGDPAFAVEHTRWVDDWAANPPDAFDLAVDSVTRTQSGEALGVLEVTWQAGEQDVRTADLDARFTRAPGGGWLYAGEAWVSRAAEQFVVRVAPGLEPQLDVIREALPDVYSAVTEGIDYEPAAKMEIKLYDGPADLVATVRLGLPNIHGWNEPGESLKMRLDPDVPSLTPTIAHEFTHFAGFDRAGTQRTRMPWWLDEGIASFIGYGFEGPELGEFQLQRVRGWAATGALVEWEEMAVFETTPEEIWPNAYAQGYAMVRFISETLGTERRNAWLAAMATEMDIEEATSAHLGTTFEELDAEFRAWLGQ